MLHHDGWGTGCSLECFNCRRIGDFKCVDCTFGQHYCQDCILDQHLHCPLHHIIMSICCLSVVTTTLADVYDFSIGQEPSMKTRPSKLLGSLFSLATTVHNILPQAMFKKTLWLSTVLVFTSSVFNFVDVTISPVLLILAFSSSTPAGFLHRYTVLAQPSHLMFLIPSICLHSREKHLHTTFIFLLPTRQTIQVLSILR